MFIIIHGWFYCLFHAPLVFDLKHVNSIKLMYFGDEKVVKEEERLTDNVSIDYYVCVNQKIWNMKQYG